jgi:hypothetical protein
VFFGYLSISSFKVAGRTVQTGDTQGYWEPKHHWGLVFLDWGTGSSYWNADGPMHANCTATLTENCRRLKAAGLVDKCFIYHNTMRALQWIESQRAVMYDATKRDWFLQYEDSAGRKNGTIYNAKSGAYDQYLWDYRNPEAAAYIVAATVNDTMSPYVDGSFTDDTHGMPDECEDCQQAIGMSEAQLVVYRNAVSLAGAKLIKELAAAGKGTIQGLESQYLYAPTDAAGCQSFMEKYTQPSFQKQSMVMFASHAPGEPLEPYWPSPNQTLAMFLVSRPPVAYLGWGWESNDNMWSSTNETTFCYDVGEPLALGKQSAPGEFQRDYHNAALGRTVTVRIDCKNFAADLGDLAVNPHCH